MRRAAAALTLLLAALPIVAGCGAIEPFVAETPGPTSPAVGVVIAVDSAGLGDVRSFTLRGEGGFSFVFEVGPLENPTEFPPGHLREHLVSAEPVRAFFRTEGGRLVAYRLEDASGGS